MGGGAMGLGSVVYRVLDGGDSNPVGVLMRRSPCVPLVPASPRRSKQRLGHPAISSVLGRKARHHWCFALLP